MPRVRSSETIEKKKPVRRTAAKPKAKPARKTAVRKTVRKKTPLAELEPAEAVAATWSVPSIEEQVPSLAHGHTVYQHGQGNAKKHNLRRQQLTITVGIVVFMLIIMTAWIMNLKHVITAAVQPATPSSSNQVDFETLKKDLTKSLNEVQSSLNTLNAPTSTITPAATPLVTSTITPTVTPSTLP